MKRLLLFLIVVSLLVFALPINAQLMDSAFPKYGYDLNNTAQSPYYSNSNGTVKWTFTASGEIYTTPTIDSNGIIYFGDYNNKVYAIYPNGTQKWTFTANDAFYASSPAIASDGTIYIGTSFAGGTLYAINPDGTQKWSFLTGGAIESSPSIDSNGIIYFGSDDDKLYALYPNGTQKWNYTTGGIIRTNPAISTDGMIYFGSADHKIYALYPDGTQKWNYTTGSWVDLSSPAIGSDGTVYIGSDDNKLYAIYPNGTLKWTYTTGGYLNSISVGSDDTIYFPDWDYYFYALYPNGTLKWKFDTNTGIAGDKSSAIIDSNGIIYFGNGGSINKVLYALYPNGTQKWNYTAGGNLLGSSPSIGCDGTLYIGAGDKKLYAFDSQSSGQCYDPSGYVSNTLGAKLQGAKVKLSNATWNASSTSNAIGYWHVNIYASGTYTYTVTKNEYVQQTGSAFFIIDESPLNFTLACLGGLSICTPPPYNNNGFNVINFDFQGNGFNLVNFSQIYLTGGLILPDSTTITTANKSIGWVFDNNGSAITAPDNYSIVVSSAGTIKGLTVISDKLTTATFNVTKASFPSGGAVPTYSDITGGNQVTLTNAGSLSDSTLAGWTKTLAYHNVLFVNVASNDNATSLTFQIEYS